MEATGKSRNLAGLLEYPKLSRLEELLVSRKRSLLAFPRIDILKGR